MAVSPIKLGLTRDQLASFLQDFEQIKQFEKLFALVDAEVAPNAVTEATILAGSADARAQQALDTLERMTNALEALAAAPVIENNNSVVTDYADFRVSAPDPSPIVGRVYWNGGTTIGVQMTPNVVGRCNEDQFYYIKASAGITKGQVIMFDGAVGASGVVKGKPATAVPNGSYIMGIAAENIANNSFGLVQAFGSLRGINTNAYTDGDILWYDPAVTGGLTNVEPLAPNVKVQVAAVTNAANNGSIVIRVAAGSTLGGTDSNVQFTPLSDGDIIEYNSALGYWQNVPASSVQVLSWLGL